MSILRKGKVEQVRESKPGASAEFVKGGHGPLLAATSFSDLSGAATPVWSPVESTVRRFGWADSGTEARVSMDRPRVDSGSASMPAGRRNHGSSATGQPCARSNRAVLLAHRMPPVAAHRADWPLPVLLPVGCEFA
jgi:hypothetical protein